MLHGPSERTRAGWIPHNRAQLFLYLDIFGDAGIADMRDGTSLAPTTTLLETTLEKKAKHT